MSNRFISRTIHSLCSHARQSVGTTLMSTCLWLAWSPGLVAEDKQPAAIDVGSRKQLFIDDRFIASSRGVELVMNPPYRDGKVLLAADQPWESGHFIGIYSSVMKEGDKVRIWYDLRRPTPGGSYSHQLRVCYAESDNGIDF